MNAIQRPLMTEHEARDCVQRINSGLEDVRVQLLELYEREGWRALGYPSWRECATTEFHQSQAYLYRQLQAAQVESEISPIGEIGKIPESQLRPLATLPSVKRPEAWNMAVKDAGDNPVTAKTSKGQNQNYCTHGVLVPLKYAEGNLASKVVLI